MANKKIRKKKKQPRLASTEALASPVCFQNDPGIRAVYRLYPPPAAPETEEQRAE